MAISVAFFGLGVGSLMIHLQKDSIKWKSKYQRKELLSSRIIYFAVAYAVSVPVFVYLISSIPPTTSDIYLFYLVSSVPFFFIGSVMALAFHAMPRNISKLYFADLVGAASATLILDPLMQRLGAENVILLTAPLVVGSAIIGMLALTRKSNKNDIQTKAAGIQQVVPIIKITPRLKIFASFVLAGTILLPLVGNSSGLGNIFEVNPGPNKGLYYQLANQSRFTHLSEQWNSFSRIDVTSKTAKEAGVNNNNNNNNNINPSPPRELASVVIDADADTPIFRWNGSKSDLTWLQAYMDYLPYAMQKINSTLVIGGGGGEDIQTALAGGSQKVTAVELNPLIASAVKRFGSPPPGNVYYGRNDVALFIDDGRHFISSTNAKYDTIVIKLVDSWAAQLAGGYALSENYLYTTEAFQQYLRHLNNNGMLVMIRWNFELPRLMPLVVDSLVKETGESREHARSHVIVVEDRPGLYFGRTNDNQKYYPVLVIIKPTPFTNTQLDLANENAIKNHASLTMLADRYIQSPYDKLFNNNPDVTREYFSTLSNPNIPTDNSPFYFAKETVPQQMVILLETVIGISVALSVVLVIHAKSRKKTKINPVTGFHILFAMLIGLGFMFFEITFIQRFLLILGTPIMALSVILFSILLSSGIGAYLSGRIFAGKPYRAVLVSVPILASIILADFFFLQRIIDWSIAMDLPYRITLTAALLAPIGLLMGFQFPSLISMASLMKNNREEEDDDSTNNDSATTLLWGVNVIASIIGTVLAATLAMIIGFSGNLLFGLGMYAGAGVAAMLALLTLKAARVTIVGGDAQ